MPRTEPLFVTQLYRSEIADPDLLADLAAACLGIAEEDRGGQAWSRANGYRGYTSYASLADLPERASVFADLVGRIDTHVAHFARALEFDLQGRKLEFDSLWINVLEPGGHHTAHIHPHAVVSGTFYVDVPKGTSAIRFEDPRLTQMMAAPPRKTQARRAHRSFVSVDPEAGTLLLWESWLRHEVPVNNARRARISLSFNWRWA
jgi:uncharacterized protein (TIGR02466 family)